MDGHKERAIHYRQKAVSVRTIIPDIKDPKTRETYERIAADYDPLARIQEQLANMD